jgi:hypothetical protein
MEVSTSLQSGTSVFFRRAGRRQFMGHLKGSAVMSAAAITSNTIRLHRVLRAAPERIYRAFLDADAMAKWLPPNGFTAKVLHMDARVGGTHRMSFTNSARARVTRLGGPISS